MNAHQSTRREFLQVGGAAAAGLIANPARSAQQKDARMLIIDCHAHIYGEDEQRYPTIEKPYRHPRERGPFVTCSARCKPPGSTM